MTTSLPDKPERITYLEGTYLDEGILSIEETLGNKRWLGVLTSPSVVQVVSVIATRDIDTPMTRHELVEESGVSDSSASKSIKALGRVGAIARGGAIAFRGDVGRPVHTTVPGPALPSLIEAIPEWQAAIERRRVDTDIRHIASELNLTRYEALRLLVDGYQRSQAAPTD